MNPTANQLATGPLSAAAPTPVRIIPVLLLKHWGIEKSIGFRDFVYVGSPVNAARVLSDLGADELIVLDIAATPEGRGPDTEVVAQMAAEVRMPLTVGGGIHRLADLESLLAAGADRVVLNTALHESPGLVREAADRFGSQCVVASIDARRRADGSHQVFTRCGRVATGRDPADCARQAVELGAGEILVTSIDRDGSLTGYDLELVRTVSQAVAVPVVACGGAGSVADLAAAVDQAGASAAAAGALFVFWGPRRTVLVNFPTEDELVEHLGRQRVRRRWPAVPRWAE